MTDDTTSATSTDATDATVSTPATTDTTATTDATTAPAADATTDATASVITTDQAAARFPSRNHASPHSGQLTARAQVVPLRPRRFPQQTRRGSAQHIRHSAGSQARGEAILPLRFGPMAP